MENKKKFDKSLNRTLVSNILKTLIAYTLSSLAGYSLYSFLLNGTNIQNPIAADIRTSIFSIVIFAIFVYLSVIIYNLPTKDERKLDEKNEINKLQIESGYKLDYREYFKTQFKTRIWAAFIPIFVLQLPLLINFGMCAYANDFTIYTSPINLFKFYMPSMFIWEILGPCWFLAPLLFTLIYAVVFTAALYNSQKKIRPSKPEWYMG